MSHSDSSIPLPFGSPPTGRRRVVLVGGAAAVLLAAAAAAYLLTRDHGEPATPAHQHGAASGAPAGQPVMLTADQARRIGVTYATATVEPLAKEIRTVGQITYDETRVRAVSPKIDGWVERLDVDYTGMPVRAGAPLLGIYSPMLVTAQEELLLAERLARDVAAGTPDAVRQANDLVESARRRLASWDVSPEDVDGVERTGEVRRTVTLRSPAGGYVVEKNVLAGQRVMAGDALYRIADLSVVWVEGAVFEQDIAAVRVGQDVGVELDAYPGERRAGRITYIYPALDPETRTVRVRVELPNPGLKLKPGMYATVRIRGRETAGVLSVPRSAVLATGERSLVFVRRPDGMLEPRDVRTGVATDDRVEIRSGLAAGETVVSSATFLIDAESSLGSALGGMGDMPGMDMTAPTRGPAATAATAAPPTTARE